MAVHYWGKGVIELHYADCAHSTFIPLGHTADHLHCYTCHPELAKEPLAGCCEDCRIKRERERTAPYRMLASGTASKRQMLSAPSLDWRPRFQQPRDCAQFCAHYRTLLSATECLRGAANRNCPLHL